MRQHLSFREHIRRGNAPSRRLCRPRYDVITIAGISDHLRLEWPITITGMRMWRVFRRHRAEPSARLVDNREGYCAFTVAPSQILDTCGSVWEKKIVRVEKDQNGIALKRPGTVRRGDLTHVRFAEHGFDPVPIARHDCARVVRRAVVNNDDFAQRVVSGS